MKKNIAAIFILTVLVLFGCSSGEVAETEQISETEKDLVEKVPVKVITVTSEDFSEYGYYYGKASGIREAVLSTSLGGTVESIEVKEGELVTKGMSLARINGEKSRNMYEMAVLAEKISRENYMRFKRFLQSGSASQIQVDEAHLNWLRSRDSLLDAEKARNESLCVTPIEGTVLSVNISEFEKLHPGRETFVVEDLSRMKVTFGIPESEMDGIRESNTAEVTFSTLPGKVWKGRLVNFDRKSSEQNLTFNAEIEIENADRQIMSGMTARVTLLRKEHNQELVIPVETLRVLGDKKYAMVVQGDMVVSREVITGPSDSTRVIVLSGLDAGDIIIKEGIHLVNNGSLVKVLN